MDSKQLKKSKEFLKMLEFFGVSEEDLKNLPGYIKEIEMLRNRVAELESQIEANKQKKKNEEDGKASPFANINEAISAYLKPQQELKV